MLRTSPRAPSSVVAAVSAASSRAPYRRHAGYYSSAFPHALLLACTHYPEIGSWFRQNRSGACREVSCWNVGEMVG